MCGRRAITIVAIISSLLSIVGLPCCTASHRLDLQVFNAFPVSLPLQISIILIVYGAYGVVTLSYHSAIYGKCKHLIDNSILTLAASLLWLL